MRLHLPRRCTTIKNVSRRAATVTMSDPTAARWRFWAAHEFHVEVLADEDTGEVRALLTDFEFKSVETDAKSLSINMLLGGAPSQFTLKYTDNTSPVEFQVTDESLAEAIHDGWEGEARVVIEIAGAPSTGPLAAPELGHEGEDPHEHEG